MRAPHDQLLQDNKQALMVTLSLVEITREILVYMVDDNRPQLGKCG
jgi:hypothetical protein